MNVQARCNCIGLRGFEGLKDLLTLTQRIPLNSSLLDGLFVAINRLQENFKMTVSDLLSKQSRNSMNGAQLWMWRQDVSDSFSVGDWPFFFPWWREKRNPQGPYLTYNHAGCSYVY